jgi:hypothetical protein
MAKLIIIASLLIICAGINAQNQWHINLTPGLSYVPPVPLSIQQENQETINIWAKYESAPLKLPPYYSVRLGFSSEGKGWEVEMNHLKVYLKNKPDEIGRFSISHGYNQILINRIFKTNRLNSKAGLGIVAAHPENSVRGLTLDEKKGLFNDGYYITGPVIQYGIFREIPFGNYFYLIGEARISAAYAQVPVVNGKAHAPVVAIHLQFGPGFKY